jgi:hypothetical protein
MGLEAHSHVRVIESNNEGAIAYVLGYCLKREGPTRFVNVSGDLSRVLSTRAVCVSLATYMMMSNVMASVSVKVKTLTLVHPSKETVSFRKPSRDGDMECGLNAMHQWFARAKEFEGLDFPKFHSQVLVRGRKKGEVVRASAELLPRDLLKLEEGALQAQQKDLWEDFSPAGDPVGEHAEIPAVERVLADPDDDDPDAEEALDGKAFALEVGLLPEQARLYAGNLVQVRRSRPMLVKFNGFGGRTTAEEVAFCVVITAHPWRSYEQALSGKKSWIDAALHLGLLKEEELRPQLCVELLKLLVGRHDYSPRSLARTMADMQDQFPLLDPLRMAKYAFSDLSWPRQRDRQDAVMAAFEEAAAAVAILREAASNPDMAAEAAEYMHTEPDLAADAKAKNTLQVFLDTATREQVEVLAWLMSRVADEATVEEMVENARSTQRSNLKFDPTKWPHLQRILFAIGQAGTGKTFVLQACFAWLRLNKIPFVVMAPTGCAASLVGGFTIHSMAGLVGDDSQLHSSLRLDSARGLALAQARVVFMDEYSMISSAVANAFAAAVDRLVRQLNDDLSQMMPDHLPPMGGKIVVLTGDTMQLEAVLPGASDVEVAEGQLHLAGIFRDADVIELTQVVRQTDPKFLRLLQLLRENGGNRLNKEIVEILQDYVIGDTGPAGETLEDVQARGLALAAAGLHTEKDSRAACATHRSLDALQASLVQLEEDDGEVIEKIPSQFIAGNGIVTWLRENNRFVIRHVVGIKAKDWQENFFKREWNKRWTPVSKTVPLELTLRVGQAVMIQRNVDLKGKIVNGTMAEVAEFIKSADGEVIAIGLKFADGSKYAMGRMKINTLTSWRGDPVTQLQMPLANGKALTLHKLQGITMKNGTLYVCMSDSMSKALLYVALSRLTRLDQLKIYGITKAGLADFAVRTNPMIEAHAAEFVARAQLKAHLVIRNVVLLPLLKDDKAGWIFDHSWHRHREANWAVKNQLDIQRPDDRFQWFPVAVAPHVEGVRSATWAMYDSNTLVELLRAEQEVRRSVQAAARDVDGDANRGGEPDGDVDEIGGPVTRQALLHDWRTKWLWLSQIPLGEISEEQSAMLDEAQQAILELEADLAEEREDRRDWGDDDDDHDDVDYEGEHERDPGPTPADTAHWEMYGDGNRGQPGQDEGWQQWEQDPLADEDDGPAPRGSTELAGLYATWGPCITPVTSMLTVLSQLYTVHSVIREHSGEPKEEDTMMIEDLILRWPEVNPDPFQQFMWMHPEAQTTLIWPGSVLTTVLQAQPELFGPLASWTIGPIDPSLADDGAQIVEDVSIADAVRLIQTSAPVVFLQLGDGNRDFQIVGEIPRYIDLEPTELPAGGLALRCTRVLHSVICDFRDESGDRSVAVFWYNPQDSRTSWVCSSGSESHSTTEGDVFAALHFQRDRYHPLVFCYAQYYCAGRAVTIDGEVTLVPEADSEGWDLGWSLPSEAGFRGPDDVMPAPRGLSSILPASFANAPLQVFAHVDWLRETVVTGEPGDSAVIQTFGFLMDQAVGNLNGAQSTDLIDLLGMDVRWPGVRPAEDFVDRLLGQLPQRLQGRIFMSEYGNPEDDQLSIGGTVPQLYSPDETLQLWVLGIDPRPHPMRFSDVTEFLCGDALFHLRGVVARQGDHYIALVHLFTWRKFDDDLYVGQVDNEFIRDLLAGARDDWSVTMLFYERVLVESSDQFAFYGVDMNSLKMPPGDHGGVFTPRDFQQVRYGGPLLHLDSADEAEACRVPSPGLRCEY